MPLQASPAGLLGRFTLSGFMLSARILGRFTPSGFVLHTRILNHYAPSAMCFALVSGWFRILRFTLSSRKKFFKKSVSQSTRLKML